MADQGKDLWVERAAEAYETSTTYVDSNYRSQWEEGLAHFRSEHAPDSKYHKDAYKYRSKIFRPKTRASIRANEAACVTAFFSNEDVVSCEGANPNDPMQKASAEIMQEILNYRLTKTIPWFQLVVGGFQDAQTVGVVCSRQDWEYEERPVKFEVPEIDPFTGQPAIDENGEFIVSTVTEYEVVKDQPCVTLFPVENLRIHPASDWKDPIGSSPYIIELMPMSVQDVLARMKSADSKTGEPKWKKLSEKQLSECRKLDDDSTREKREDREDKFDTTSDKLGDFDTVWIHRNIMRVDGKDVVYYTAGTKYLLSDPVLVTDIYPQGRPYVMGCCVIETHKVYPSGVAHLGSPIQKEINEVCNQRIDNIKLVLNKRYYVKRGSQVDTQSLLRNVPGSVTFVNDPSDIQEAEFSDVTGSSYQEQDRLNVDYDEVTGTFSTGSVNTNRKLGETVGGMTMLRGTSNQLTEYLLRTFAETWVEPVLRQLVKLEQKLESDMVVLSFAAEQANLFDRYGISEVNDKLLDQELKVTVNVGMGATDPVQKLERFVMAVGQYTQMAMANGQLGPAGLDLDEVRKEIFGRLGYKDGGRFFPKEQAMAMQEQMQQMQQNYEQQLQQMQQALADKSQKEQAQMQAKFISDQQKAQATQAKSQADVTIAAMENENALRLKMMDLANPVAGETRWMSRV